MVKVKSRNLRTVLGEVERIALTRSHQNRNKGELVETVSKTGTGAIPAKGGALTRGRSVVRVRMETARSAGSGRREGLHNARRQEQGL